MGAALLPSRHRPQQVRQAIQIRHHERLFPGCAAHSHPLCAPYHRTGVIEQRRQVRLTRNDKLPGQLEASYEVVDTVLQLAYHLRRHKAHARHKLSPVGRSRGNLGHENPEITLYVHQPRVQVRIPLCIGSGHPYYCLCLVDRPVDLDGRRVLPDPATVEQARGATVASLRIDASLSRSMCHCRDATGLDRA